MKYQFVITDEKTVLTDTVKVTVNVSGPANETRTKLEARVRSALGEFLKGDDINWVYTGFTIARSQGFPTFSVQAVARIPTAANNDLELAARTASDDSVNINVHYIDQSVPLHLIRKGYEEMRLNILELAVAEQHRVEETTNSKVVIKRIDFRPGPEAAFQKNQRSLGYDNNIAASASLYDEASGGGSIGYAEKIYGQASVTLEVTSADG